MSHVTDERPLLDRAKAYDPEALAELYDRYAPKMYAYIYRRVGEAALAEDLTGELFVRVLRSIRNEQAWRKSFSAWLYRIAHNLVVDHFRRERGMSHEPADELLVALEGDPMRDTESALGLAQLRAAVARLTPDQQEVITLRFGEGMTAAQVAEVMNKTTGAVEALQHRALASLRRILGEGEP